MQLFPFFVKFKKISILKRVSFYEGFSQESWSNIWFATIFSSILYNITVSESLSQKRVLSIRDFQSGQSFSMSFSKAGEYEICFSSKKNVNVLRTCLQVDVLQAKLI